MKKLIAIYSLLLMFACEWPRYSMIDSSINADTFSVEIFEEQAANAPAGYGIQFTEFLRDFVVSRSKLKLKKEEADIEITGKVTSYYTSPVSLQGDELAAQNRLTVVIKVTCVNNIEEKESFEKNFSQFSDYNSDQDLSSVETTLLEDINEKLSQDIVNQLSSNW